MKAYANPTARQVQILEFLAAHQDTHGRMPTLREVASAFGIGSTNGVHVHIAALARRGLLERIRGLARATRITQAGYIAIGRTGPASASQDRYVTHSLEKARAALRVA